MKPSYKIDERPGPKWPPTEAVKSMNREPDWVSDQSLIGDELIMKRLFKRTEQQLIQMCLEEGIIESQDTPDTDSIKDYRVKDELMLEFVLQLFQYDKFKLLQKQTKELKLRIYQGNTKIKLEKESIQKLLIKKPN